jgi:hypothetical protein
MAVFSRQSLLMPAADACDAAKSCTTLYTRNKLDHTVTVGAAMKLMPLLH